MFATEAELNKCFTCDKEGVPLYVCEDCDEFGFCDDCMVPCSCGKGNPHRLCKEGDHFCRSGCCTAYVCSAAKIPIYRGCTMDYHDPSQWEGDVWCPQHRPPVSPQMVTLVLNSLGITREEVQSLKKRKRK